MVVQVPQEPTQSEAGRLFLDLLDPSFSANPEKRKAGKQATLKDQRESFLYE